MGRWPIMISTGCWHSWLPGAIATLKQIHASMLTGEPTNSSKPYGVRTTSGIASIDKRHEGAPSLRRVSQRSTAQIKLT